MRLLCPLCPLCLVCAESCGSGDLPGQTEESVLSGILGILANWAVNDRRKTQQEAGRKEAEDIHAVSCLEVASVFVHIPIVSPRVTRVHLALCVP